MADSEAIRCARGGTAVMCMKPTVVCEHGKDGKLMVTARVTSYFFTTVVELRVVMIASSAAPLTLTSQSPASCTIRPVHNR